MAKVELKIDTTEAMEKIKALKTEAEKFNAAMIEVKKSADDTTKAMRDFFDACRNIDVDLYNIQKRALYYIKSTNGGITKADFIGDHSPIGEALLTDMYGMIREDENGRIWLTDEGEKELAS